MPDRYGERVDQDHEHLAPVVQLPHQCDSGWLDRDADQPRPCLACRPWLARSQPPLPPPDPTRIQAGVQLCRDAIHNGPTTGSR